VGDVLTGGMDEVRLTGGFDGSFWWMLSELEVFLLGILGLAFGSLYFSNVCSLIVSEVGCRASQASSY